MEIVSRFGGELSSEVTRIVPTGRGTALRPCVKDKDSSRLRIALTVDDVAGLEGADITARGCGFDGLRGASVVEVRATG
jgi:hypothetical protein